MTPSLPVPAADIAAYYDDGYEGCLRDYVHGNARIRLATDFFLSRLTARPTARRVLDVGCGIGHSAHALAQRCDWLEIVGVDISEKRIAAAKRLFRHPRLRFYVGDMEHSPEEGPFDAILMMDVYEHIPQARRTAFHKLLSGLLSSHGIVLLTTPSPLHQVHLAGSRPEALQIVDEIITVDEIAALGQALEGTVTHFAYTTVWYTNDYVHSALERAPAYERRTTRRSVVRRILDKAPTMARMALDDWRRGRRAAHVHRELGVQVR